MNAFGNVNDSTGKCQVKYIDEGDHVSKVFYQYSQIGINLLLIGTAGGKNLSFGTNVQGSQTQNFDFSKDAYMFFGFAGTWMNDQAMTLNSLGVVRYDFACVEKERFALKTGTFTWGVNEKG